MNKIKGLGKGLSALLGENNEKENIVDLKNFKSDKTPIHQLMCMRSAQARLTASCARR